MGGVMRFPRGEQEFCWLNGRLMRVSEARIDPGERGFLLGDGVFETLLLRRGAAVWWGEHMARLWEGAAALGIAMPWEEAALAAAAREVVEANGLGEVARAALRVSVSRGVGARGLLPVGVGEASVLARAAGAARPASMGERVDAVVARSARRNEWSVTSRHKTLSRVDEVLAMREAAAAGASEALLMNGAGRLACGARGNLFVWRGGELVTPAVREGCLPGVARAHVMAAASEVGVVCCEGEVEGLREGDGAFLTNSLVGAVGLSAVGEVTLLDCNRVRVLRGLFDALSARMTP